MQFGRSRIAAIIPNQCVPTSVVFSRVDVPIEKVEWYGAKRQGHTSDKGFNHICVPITSTTHVDSELLGIDDGRMILKDKIKSQMVSCGFAVAIQ
jgi:hypothetical protein